MQMRPGTDFGLGPHLALVHAGVPGLDIFDLQCPHAGGVCVERLVPVVSDECQSIHGEDVVVAHTNPGDGFIGQLTSLEEEKVAEEEEERGISGSRVVEEGSGCGW